MQIAAAAEVYARPEGIVNIYSDETPGKSVVHVSEQRTLRGWISAM